MSTQFSLDRQTLATLRANNVAKVVIAFSGGNDEGGPDSIQYFDQAGEEISLTDASRGELEGADGYINQGLSMFAPIDDRFGTWAGEFEAHGELTWDVSTGIGTMSGEESTYTSVEW